MKKHLPVILMIGCIMYLLIAFATWKVNIAEWSSFARVSFLAGTFVLIGAYFSNGED